MARGHRLLFFFFSSRRRHTRCGRDWSSDVCSSDLFRLDVIDPSETRPPRREPRILGHAAFVEIARDAPLLRIDAELIAAQKEIVRGLTRRDIGAESLLVARGEWNGQRVDDASRQLILKLEEV